IGREASEIRSDNVRHATQVDGAEPRVGRRVTVWLQGDAGQGPVYRTCCVDLYDTNIRLAGKRIQHIIGPDRTQANDGIRTKGQTGQRLSTASRIIGSVPRRG